MVDFVHDSFTDNESFNDCSKSIVWYWIIFITLCLIIDIIDNMGGFILEESHFFCNIEKAVDGVWITSSLVNGTLAWHHARVF